jgi:tryptophan 2,3-dioxygenase
MSETAHGHTSSIDYGSYLRLPELLELQTLQSTPEHPDELLFIVVHQASELWFKVLRHEMDTMITALEAFDTMRALLAVQRVNVLTEIIAQQLTALDTLPPQRFAQFRGYLGSSSGSQSAQFRAIEATAGLRDPHFLAAITEHGEPPAVVTEALARPVLQSLVLALIAMFILGVMLGLGYLFRDVVDPPRPQVLTPLPSGVTRPSPVTTTLLISTFP